MKNYKYIITSGWWCDNDTSDDRQKKLGDAQLREVNFFSHWHEAIARYSCPEKLLIIDSASPVKPDLKKFNNVHFMPLDYNPGHPTKHLNKYSGVTYAHVLGMTYSMLEDFDYWVYVEQDALIYGEGIIEYAISQMDKKIMFGSGLGTPQPMQQSLMIFHKDAIGRFVNDLNKISLSDCQFSPEMKFAVAASPIFRFFPNFAAQLILRKGFLGRVCRKLFFRLSNSSLSGYQALPFGYGRARPINFDDEYYYFQHGTAEELRDYLERVGASGEETVEY